MLYLHSEQGEGFGALRLIHELERIHNRTPGEFKSIF